MYKILVGSGKGGVGKSTTAAALALYFRRNGLDVGLLDADLAGPSLPVLLGRHEAVAVKDDLMLPVVARGLKCMSTGFLAPDDRAVVWSGAMLEGALWQMIHQTDWGPMDLLVVDLPPGTNELHIRIIEEMGDEVAVVLVTNEDALSIADTIRSIDFLLELHLPPAAAAVTPVGMVCRRCATRFPRQAPVLSVGGYEVPTVMIPSLSDSAAVSAASSPDSLMDLVEGRERDLPELDAALASLAELCEVRAGS